MRLPRSIYRSRFGYWLTARRCTCRGAPIRFRGCTLQVGGTVHRLDAPCFECDTYGQPVEARGGAEHRMIVWPTGLRWMARWFR